MEEWDRQTWLDHADAKSGVVFFILDEGYDHTDLAVHKDPDNPKHDPVEVEFYHAVKSLSEKLESAIPDIDKVNSYDIG